MRLSPQRLLALGPIPSRLARGTEDLIELMLVLEAGYLQESGVYAIPEDLLRSEAA